ncbi:kinase-like domain-containing protein [Mycena filopes]|nr:kinase-like domain-containing protein [Mycena filopes]
MTRMSIDPPPCVGSAALNNGQRTRVNPNPVIEPLRTIQMLSKYHFPPAPPDPTATDNCRLHVNWWNSAQDVDFGMDSQAESLDMNATEWFIPELRHLQDVNYRLQFTKSYFALESEISVLMRDCEQVFGPNKGGVVLDDKPTVYMHRAVDKSRFLDFLYVRRVYQGLPVAYFRQGIIAIHLHAGCFVLRWSDVEHLKLLDHPIFEGVPLLIDAQNLEGNAPLSLVDLTTRTFPIFTTSRLLHYPNSQPMHAYDHLLSRRLAAKLFVDPFTEEEIYTIAKITIPTVTMDVSGQPLWPNSGTQEADGLALLALNSHLLIEMSSKTSLTAVSGAAATCSVSNVTCSPSAAALASPSPSLKEFDVLHLIGRGKTSIVYLVREKTTGKLYALKQAPKEAQVADIQEEQRLLKSIADLPDAPKSLLSLVASWSDSEYFYLLTPWCAGKDLSSLLTSGRFFSVNRTKAHMVQLILAVQTLHDMKIIHRDIKPANIFLTQDGNVILGDFGFAKHFATSLTTGNQEPTEVSFDVDPNASAGSFFKPTEDDESCTTRERCGTLHWMSPAQIAGTAYSFDADVLALGVVMHQMSTGRLPFPYATTPEELGAAYAQDLVTFRCEDGLDANAKDLITGMLARDVGVRLTLEEVKEHSYFNGVDWSAAPQHSGPTPWAPPAAFVPKEPPRRQIIKDGVARESGVDAFAFVAPGFYKKPNVLKVFAAKVLRLFSKPKAATAVLPTTVQPPVKNEVKSQPEFFAAKEKDQNENVFSASSRARKPKSSTSLPVIKSLASKVRALFKHDRWVTPVPTLPTHTEPTTYRFPLVSCGAYSQSPKPTLMGRIRRAFSWRRAPRPFILANGTVLMRDGRIKAGNYEEEKRKESAVGNWFRARFCAKTKSRYVDLGIVSADSLYW